MICHVVLIRLREREKTDWILRQARELLGSIPVVKNFRAGTGIYPDNPHPLCLIMDFDDEAALASYQAHGNHVKFRDEILGPLAEDKKVYDYALRDATQVAMA